MNIWVASLIIINIIGTIYGIYYYIPQLSSTPIWFWLLVVDCPLFTFLFALSLLLDIKSEFFNFFTSVGLIKYGFWTVFTVWLMFEQFMKVDPIIYPILIFLHIGMTFEFIFLLSKLKISKLNFLTIPIFLINDYSDYFLGTHPWLPSTSWLSLLTQVSFVSSLLIPILLTATIALYQHCQNKYGYRRHPKSRAGKVQHLWKKGKG